MANDLINPLQAIIEKVAGQKPTGEVARLRRRQENATTAVVILADVSASMAEVVGAQRKIEILRDALSRVWPQSSARLIAFSSIPQFLASPAEIPEPSGSTALHFAIQAAQAFRPGQTIVISDGQPDDEQASLDAADNLTGQIDVIYCGPEGNTQAIAFLMRLARRTGGQYHATTPQNLIEPVRRLLLLSE